MTNKPNKPIAAIVAGASGYVGHELLRLIAGHPTFTLSAALSDRLAGSRIAAAMPTLRHAYPNNPFTALDAAVEQVQPGTDIAVFAAAPHGTSGAVVARLLEQGAAKKLNVRVVDVSADFRYPSTQSFEAVYSMSHPAPELVDQFHCALPEHVADAPTLHVGHPGCFATAMLLAAVPALTAGLVEPDIVAVGITGSTGSGKSPSAGTHHPERHSNLYAYKPLTHRHVPEVETQLEALAGRPARVDFVPHSGPFARGIYMTLHFRLLDAAAGDKLEAAFQDHYARAPFVHVVSGTPRLKDVVASNYAHIGIATTGDRAVVTCAIDNLVKGAAGGALQWMNRLWSLPETAGLEQVPPGLT